MTARLILLTLAVATLGPGRVAAAVPPLLATQPADFVQPGTQPSAAEFGDFFTSVVCSQCHGGYRESDDEPFDAWVASMMAQSARDPVMRAAAAIANHDAASSGETCIRCHAPIGWLGGRSTGGDFAALETNDLDGVTCHVCHRLLDPIARPGAPAADAAILDALDMAGTRPRGRCTGDPAVSCTTDADCGAAGSCAVEAGQGRFVVDPNDARRGPRMLSFHLHTTTSSPFHLRADACAPCHDVSTPTFSRQPDGSYDLNPLGAEHPTQRPGDMFPEQRTYSEWRASAFAAAGVVFADGRFGGTKTAVLPNMVPVSTCQDCHMPSLQMAPCLQGDEHPDVGGHFFSGANAWVLGAVLDEHGAASGLTAESVSAAQARTQAMMEKASDLEVTQVGYTLTVRVVNQTGHKLPTGYPEGRRVWLGVRYFAGTSTTPIAEDGAYDAATAVLDVAHTTKIYEVRQVVADDVAALTGLAAGTPFHLVLNGAIAADNRIPPRGFTGAAFAVFGGAPVGAQYADGQYWDDTTYTIPIQATRVEVSLYHQTTTKEYAEFLRDTAPDASGGNAYDRWVARGRSAPVVMDRVAMDLVPICTPDGGACEDGNPCTTGDVCQAGACTPGPVSPCPDDGNACTDDVCSPASGTCGVPRPGSCDDGDACTTADTCGEGACGGIVTGFDGLRCVLERLRAGDACGEPLPRKLARFVVRRAGKALRVAGVAERKRTKGAPARSVDRLLDQVERSLDAVAARLPRATTARKPAERVPAACADAIDDIVTKARMGLGSVRAVNGG